MFFILLFLLFHIRLFFDIVLINDKNSTFTNLLWFRSLVVTVFGCFLGVSLQIPWNKRTFGLRARDIWESIWHQNWFWLHSCAFLTSKTIWFLLHVASLQLLLDLSLTWKHDHTFFLLHGFLRFLKALAIWKRRYKLQLGGRISFWILIFVLLGSYVVNGLYEIGLTGVRIFMERRDRLTTHVALVFFLEVSWAIS